MRFSEAMRRGAAMGPQLRYQRHAYGVYQTAEYENATCAIGAAELGAGLDAGLGWNYSYWLLHKAEIAWPWIMTHVKHPLTGEFEEARSIVASLNNGVWDPWPGRDSRPKAWSREQIADWVETLPQDLEDQIRDQIQTRDQIRPDLNFKETTQIQENIILYNSITTLVEEEKKEEEEKKLALV